MHVFLYAKRVYSLGFKTRHTYSSIYSNMSVCLSVVQKGAFYKIVTSSNTFMIPFIKLIYLRTLGYLQSLLLISTTDSNTGRLIPVHIDNFRQGVGYIFNK